MLRLVGSRGTTRAAKGSWLMEILPRPLVNRPADASVWRFAQWARRRRRLMMEDFGLDLDRRLDRVGDKAIVFGFFQDSRHTREIAGRRKNHLWLDDDLRDLITAPRQFLQLSLCRRGTTNESNFREFRDRNQRENITAVQ